VCGSGRDPRGIAMSVSMKEAKGAPSPKVDLLARRALRRAKRLFLVLRDQLQAWRETRKLRGAEGDHGLSQNLAQDLSCLGWGSARAFAGSSSGGSSSGGGVRNTGPPSPASMPPAPARAARSVGFGLFMASFLVWIAAVGLTALTLACSGGHDPDPIIEPVKPTVVYQTKNFNVIDSAVDSGSVFATSIDALVKYSDNTSPYPVIQDITIVGTSPTAGAPVITYVVSGNGTQQIVAGKNALAPTTTADSTYTFNATTKVTDVQSSNNTVTFNTPVSGVDRGFKRPILIPDQGADQDWV